MAEPNLKDPPVHFKSKVWTHCGFRVSSEARDIATCRICYTDVKTKAGSTTNLANHLKRRHEIVCVAPATNPTTSSSSTGTSDERSKTGQLKLTDLMPKLTDTRKKAITKSIGGYIAFDMRPYSSVQNEGFRNMIKVLEPRYSIPSRTYFSQTVLPELLETVKTRVITHLNNAESISITTDSWTSRATENYIAVTAHFINNNWEVENFTLQTRNFSEAHTSENLSKDLIDTVKEWKLEKHGIGPTVTTDNASNIVKAVKESGLHPHIGCYAHTLNLATQRGLKVSQMDRLLGRVRRVVAFFHKSTSATSCLSAMQKKLEIPNHKLIMDVPTRWNSTFEMLSRYVEQQAAVFAAIIELKKKLKDLVTLSDVDISNIEQVLYILKPIKTVTTMMCSETHPTVSLIHPLKEMLLQHLDPSNSPDDNTLITEVKNAIYSDLKSRYTDKAILEFLLQASVVDPRFKSLPYLDDAEKHEVYSLLAKKVVDYSNSLDETVTVKKKSANVQVSDLPDIHIPAARASSDDDLSQDSPPAKIIKTQNISQPHKSALSDLFGDVFATKVEPGRTLFEKAELEIQNYKKEQVLDLNQNPLMWWKSKATLYPIISKYAKFCLGVPATSVASERVFSTAGDVVTAKRACLSSDNVDMLVFLSKNMTAVDLL